MWNTGRFLCRTLQCYSHFYFFSCLSYMSAQYSVWNKNGNLFFGGIIGFIFISTLALPKIQVLYFSM